MLSTVGDRPDHRRTDASSYEKRHGPTPMTSRLIFHLVGDNMARKTSRSRLTRRPVGRGADYVALGVIGVASIALAALALSGVSLRPGPIPSAASHPVSTNLESPVESATPTPTPEPPVSLSLLSDQSSDGESTWWDLSVTAGLVPGVVEGADLLASADEDSAPTPSDLGARIAAAPTLAGYVLVQFGAEALDEGAIPSDVASDVETLWQAVVAKGAIPVAILVSPSNENGPEVIELNGLLQNAAVTAGYPVLDLYSSVAASDGSWASTFSDDGLRPNVVGSETLAQVAIAQLPQMTAKK
jgi:hypothetical protein